MVVHHFQTKLGSFIKNLVWQKPPLEDGRLLVLSDGWKGQAGTVFEVWPFMRTYMDF